MDIKKTSSIKYDCEISNTRLNMIQPRRGMPLAISSSKLFMFFISLNFICILFFQERKK
ncbi:hypothetical protein Bca4012_101606 [Brassica carinata]